MMLKRILYSLFVCGVIFFGHWWIGIICIIIGSFLFKNYYEAIAILFLYESAFLPANQKVLVATSITLVCVLFIEYIKPKLL